ncbi:MAG: hypothetical protein FJW31_02375 [Acidobacteria bacterium]|nr:hypothetical protein [Acidobacteriota bacterium]
MRRLFPSLLLATSAALAQDWTSRDEYDLALAVRAQKAPAQRLPLLEQWKQKFPNSALRPQRAEMILAAAQFLGDKTKMTEAARELVAVNADHFTGLYWLTLFAPQAPLAPTPAALAEAEQWARRLVKVAATQPAAQKDEVTALAHRTLGWAAWQRGDAAAAEKELFLSLAAAPRNAEVSAWLGAMMATQKEPSRQVEAIWHLARASYTDGAGALAAAQRRDVRTLLEAAYTGYHGALDGLDEIGAAAKAAAVNKPAADFKIETAAEVAQRKADEQMQATNPQLFTWVKIRRRLTGAGAQAEYQKLAEGALPLVKGYVVRCDADPKPTEVYLGLQDSAVEEVVLKLDAAQPRCPEVGIALEFEGKPVAFSAEPFRLSVAVDAKSIVGWPPPPEKK